MPSEITFVSWRWKPVNGYRSKFEPETVYALKAMIDRHHHRPHRFVCVTDEPAALPGIETIPLWDWGAKIPSPIGHSYPSCYRRLKLFAPDAGAIFGERVVSIDLDTVIVDDITPLFDRPEDFVIWGSSDFPRQAYCGSLWMLTTGTRPQAYTEFNEQDSPAQATRSGSKGSDQGWLNYILPNEATWGTQDGVYSFRKHIAKHGNRLPKNARITCWHGKVDPWSPKAQKIEWVRQHYPLKPAVAA